MVVKEANNAKKILVTGASGFIGTRLIEKLTAAAGYTVTALVRNSGKAHQLRAAGVDTIVADLADRTKIDTAVQGHHSVINLAHDFKRSQKHNLRCFSHLSQACTRHGVQHLVQVSSIVVYDGWPWRNISEESRSGKPGTEYKNTKVAIENALLDSSEKGLLHSTIIQPTIVYGPSSWMWTDHIVEKLMSGTVVLPADQESTCNAVYVDDVADALVLAVSRDGRSAEKYIISGSAVPSWQEFFESFNQFLGTDSIRYMDVVALAPGHLGTAGKLKSILANPLQLADRKPVRQVLNGMQRVMGERAVEGLKTFLQGLKKSTGPVVYYPGHHELELYCAKGKCSIEKAQKELGYMPKLDFQAGFELTAKYLEDKTQGL